MKVIRGDQKEMSVLNAPDVSIVTATYNANASIGRCLLSVAGQVGVTCEHIVIDGGSTDGTVETLREHASDLAYWCSEPDAGIADAMNKGVGHAAGEWVAFIHADDNLASPDVLAQALRKVPADADIAAFPVLFGEGRRRRLLRPRPVGPLTHFKMGMCHQGMLVRRELFCRLGGFDTSFKVCMDYEHLARAVLAGAHVFTADMPVLSCMSDGGISSRMDWPSLSTRFSEEKRVNEKYADTPLLQRVLSVYWWLYLPYRRLRAWIRDLGRHRR
ncbi:glycosyltransferase [Rhodanobacter sp. 7MK24]|uniref:glycosyltransferase family 2 protein n=1 Tax=Rhodanobacter sp. 7MK24 TaxID=2775922 RepID=UPI00177F669D|nr:glycosyltransferase family 2 protein [Rhodanobacter sp. 7MK24]MBD8880544.1 glycosyltransferase [Rhodanobacter sp. 7MK24]